MCQMERKGKDNGRPVVDEEERDRLPRNYRGVEAVSTYSVLCCAVLVLCCAGAVLDCDGRVRLLKVAGVGHLAWCRGTALVSKLRQEGSLPVLCCCILASGCY